MAGRYLHALVAWLDRHFSVALPFTRFVRNTMILSLVGLAPVLALYIALIPGFWSHLISTEAALAGFIRQILTNGLTVVFVVNSLGFFLCAQLRAAGLRPEFVLAIDIPARIGVFMGLHILIYPGSALAFGSFGGDPVQGLRVVGPTLADAASFGNLSGVYFYATLLSAFPLYLAMVGAAVHRHGYRHPLFLAPLVLAVFSLHALLLTIGAALLNILE